MIHPLLVLNIDILSIFQNMIHRQAFTAPEVPKDLPKENKKNKNLLRKISLGTLGSLGIKEDGKIFHLVP